MYVCMSCHMWHCNWRTKHRRDLRFGPFCSYCYHPGDLNFRFEILPTHTKIFYDVLWCFKNHMLHYNSRTKRRRDLRFGPFCSYCYRPGDLYFRFDMFPTKTAALSDVWLYVHSTITSTTVTRELNVVETCGLDNFVGNVTVQVTYISDLTFCSRKPQHRARSGYVYI